MSKEPFFVIFSHFFVLDFEKFGRFEASHMTVDETHLTVQYHVTSLNQSKHSLAVGDGISDVIGLGSPSPIKRTRVYPR